MSNDLYYSVRVQSLGGDGIIIAEVLKDMTVRTFKSIVIARAKMRCNADEIKLHVFDDEMLDECTLKSYGLQGTNAVITYVVSAGTIKKPREPKYKPQEKPQSNNPPPYQESTETQPKGAFKTVFVQNADGKTFALHDVPKNLTGDEFRKMFSKEKGVNLNSGNLRLIFAGKQVQNNLTMIDFDIQEGSTIYVFASLPGGSE